MTAAFAVIPPNGGLPLPTLIEVEPTTRGGAARPGPATDARLDWASPQGQALGALILRAAYLDDARLLSRVVTFIPGYVSHVRLSDEQLGDFRPVVIDCGTYATIALHGVVSDAQYRSVALDLIIPRYTLGQFQYLASVQNAGGFLSDYLETNLPNQVSVNLVAHSLGGVLGTYWASLPADKTVLARASYFGVPKLGRIGARTPLLAVALTNWMTRGDPVVGLPPSFIRLPDVPFLAAQYVPELAHFVARAIKAKLDDQWSGLQSASNSADVLNEAPSVGTLDNIDDGRNWYQRTGIGVATVLTGPGQRQLDSHKISTYYNRLRALFANWTALSAAAGPGGRGADVAALAITAAELGV